MITEERLVTYIGPWTLVGAVALIVFGAITLPKTLDGTRHVAPTATTTFATTTFATTTPNHFENVVIEAEAAYIFDIATHSSIFERNADLSLPLASLTKLMTALIAAETIPDLEKVTVILTPAMLAEDGDDGLIAYTHWTLAELVEFMLIASSNDAAAAIVATIEPHFAGKTFVEVMNTRAGELELTKTQFLNATGLDVENETAPGAYGSARDVARLLAYILEHQPVILEMTRKNIADIPEYLRFTSLSRDNTNGILDHIPWIVGSKTGFTDTAGGNLAIVFDVGLSHPIVAVILGSTITGRFTDMEVLIERTLLTL